MSEHRITLRPLSRARFSAEYNGEVIVAGSTSPEGAAAVVLFQRGVRGTLVARHAGAAHDASRLDIETAALALLPGVERLRQLQKRVSRVGPSSQTGADAAAVG